MSVTEFQVFSPNSSGESKTVAVETDQFREIGHVGGMMVIGSPVDIMVSGAEAYTAPDDQSKEDIGRVALSDQTSGYL